MLLSDLKTDLCHRMMQFCDPQSFARVALCNKEMLDRLGIMAKENVMASRMQRFWRWYGRVAATKTIAQRFLDLGLSRSAIMSMGSAHSILYFSWYHALTLGLKCDRHDGMLSYIKEERVLDVCKMLMMRLVSFSCHFPVERHLQKLPSNVTSTRMILGGYLVEHFPARVFKDMSDLMVPELRLKTTQFLTLLQQLVEALAAGQRFNQIPEARVFMRVLVEYLSTFNAWHGSNAPFVMASIKTLIRQLEANLPLIESGDEVMQLDTLEQLGHLWEKLHKIGGQEAVDQFYAELHPAPPRQNPTPTWAWLAGGMAVAAVLWTCLRSLARHQPRI